MLDQVLFDSWLRFLQHGFVVGFGGGVALFIMARIRA